MSTVNKIMVPLTFSKYSGPLLNYGISMASALESHIILVNVINEKDVETVQRISSFGYDVDAEHYVEEVEKQRIELLETMLQKVSFPKEKIRMIFKVGNPAQTLLQLVKQEGIDMIIMGVKGQSDLMHGFTGSVAEKIFRRSPVPVLSYRQKKE